MADENYNLNNQTAGEQQNYAQFGNQPVTPQPPVEEKRA